MSLFSIRNRFAFTILELLIVIGITAMMMSLAVVYVGGTPAAQVKKESGALVGAIKYAYNGAAVGNVPYRIVFDLTEQSYWVEEGSGPFYLGREEGGGSQPEKKEEETEGEEGTETEPSFAAEDSVIKKIKFDDDIKIRDVYVAHQEGIVNAGQAILYFFPHGITERAVIHLSDQEEKTNYSLIVNPVTGKTKVVSEYVEYDKLEDR